MRAKRRYYQNKHERKRIAIFLRDLDIYKTKAGIEIPSPIVDDIPKNELNFLKNQRKPCSCIFCSPYKYTRKKKHKLID